MLQNLLCAMLSSLLPREAGHKPCYQAVRVGGVQIYGRYPFDSKERDYARKFHNAEYTLPPEVPASELCKDLLQRLLVADPERRISMEDIMAHAWFQETLPTGALLMNEHYLQRAPRFTEEVRALSAHTP